MFQAGSGGAEVLVSGSDDFTLFLWRPSEGKKHVARMTGEDNVMLSHDAWVL